MFALQVKVQKGETTAARRTVPIWAMDSEVMKGKTGLTPAKAHLSKNFATPADTTNNYAEVDATIIPGLYTVELTVAEVSDLGYLVASIQKTGWSGLGHTLVEVVDYDPYSEGGKSDVAMTHQAGKPA